MTTSNEHNNAPAVPQCVLAQEVIDAIEAWKSAWLKVPPFSDRVNKATREAITISHNSLFLLLQSAQQAQRMPSGCPTPTGCGPHGCHGACIATPAPAPAQEIDKSVADADIKALYVESQGSDKGWLGIEGSYFIGGVVAARKQKAALAPAQDEPLGHFRAEPFGWTDCAKDDEGAIALYERPQDVGLTDEEIEAIAKKHMSTVGDHWSNEEAIRESHAEDFARDIISALRAKESK